MQTELSYTETELLQHIADGDEIAFGELFRQYYPMLKSFVWKFTPHESDRQEILQETFIRVWLHREEMPQIQNIKAWIFTVASKASLNYLRKVFREEQKIASYTANHSGDSGTEHAFEIVEVADIHRIVDKAVEQLAPQRQRIYRLSREEKLKPSEIAAELGLSVQTVRNTLTGVLKELREQLQAAGYPVSVMVTFHNLVF